MIPKAPLRRWAPWLILGMLALFPNLAAAQGNIATAPVNPAFLAWQKAREEEALRANAGLQPSAAEPEGGVPNYGYQPSPLDLSHIHGPVLAGSGRLARKDADFPASYDLRIEGQLTPIRDQGSFGTCWAHGALGALESSQLKAARGPFDLSEWHLAWFAYNNLNATMVSFTKGTPSFGADPTFDLGGNNWKSTALLARGTGAVAEADSPYQSYHYPTSALPKGTEPTKVRLQEALYLGSTFNSGDVKTALMDYGAVSIAFHANTSASASYYDPTNYTYRYTGSLNTNHIVDIVGWDDDFLASKFHAGNQPASNGAWIVRNSWGTGWGDQGYFYMAYDSTIYDGIAFVSGSNLVTRIYQYDPLGWVDSIGLIDQYGNPSDTAWFGNVFTAQAAEQIGAIAFNVGAPNAEYEISFRKGVTSTSPGILIGEPVSGTLAAPGYRMVTLLNPVTIPAGTRFGVSVKLRTPGYDYPIPVEYPYPGYSDKATAGAGQSYVSPDGVSWKDLTTYGGDYKKANVCLKVFATLNPFAITAAAPVTAGKAGWTASVPAQPDCTYNWTVTGGTLTAGTGTPTIIYTAGTGASVGLTCTLKNSSGVSVVFAATDVEVVAAPSATIDALSTVTASSPDLAASVLSQADSTYLWSITGGTIPGAKNLHAVTYTAGAPGTATLKCTVTNQALTAVTGTKTVAVVAAPVTTLTAAATVTAGTKALAASVPVQTGCAYAWTLVGDGTFTSVLNKNAATYTAGSAGPITLRCNVTNAAGTSSLAEKAVSVIAAPVATITAASPVLKGQTGLTAAVPDQAGTTYLWSITGGTIPGAKTSAAVTYTAGAVGTATLKCVVKNAVGTLSTGTKAVPVVATSATIMAATPVITGTTNLMASVPAGAASYVWSVIPGTLTFGQGTNSITYTAGALGTTTLSCTVPGPITGTKSVTVINFTKPTITALTPVTAGFTDLAASVPDLPGCTYAWQLTAGTSTGGAINPPGTTNAITYTSGSAGTATLSCTVSATAAGTSAIATKSLTVVAAPVATITAPLTKVTAGKTGLTASVPVQTGCTFKWTITGGTLTAGGTTRAITYTAGNGTPPLQLACTVKNAAGITASDTQDITISAAPVAAIIAPLKVTAGVGGWAASVPAVDGFSYDWSTSTGITDISSVHAASITFTGGPIGTATLKCIVTNDAAVPATATGTKVLSVLAAPVATVTAPPSVVVETPGCLASVPVQAACTYAWAATGASIDSGAGTRSITFTTDSGTATLGCTVTNAAGTAAHGTATVTASNRSITGKRIWTYLPFKATTGTLTPELSPATTSSPTTYVHALLNDGTTKLGAYNSSNGTFAIADMPGGHYWLRRGTWDYIWTDKSYVDLSLEQGGRADVVAATTDTPVVFNVSNLSYWSQGWDWLQFYDYNSTLWTEPDFEAATNWPVEGDTYLSGLTVDWSLYQNEGNHPLIDTTKGDAPQLVQMVDTNLGEIWARVAKKKFKPTPLTMVNGSTNTLNGAFLAIPLTSSVTVNFNGAEFAAANSPLNPASTTNGRTYLSFWDGPGLLAHGYTGEALQVLGTDGSGTNKNAGAAAVPALATGYQRMVRGNLKHSVDLLLPGTTIPYTFTGVMRTYSKTLPTASAPLRPMVGPVKEPKINAASLFEDTIGVGLTPTISWTAPTLGSPQGYIFWIYEVSIAGSNTTITNIAKLWLGGSQTQFQMPAGLFEAGKTYFICTRTWMESGYNPEAAPYHTSYLPYGYADSLSGLITP